MSSGSEGLRISGEQFKTMIEIISRNPVELLHSEECRKYLATDRWEKGAHHMDVHGKTDAGVMPGTVAHNRRELEQGLFGSSKRTGRLINPLRSLEPVYSRAAKLKVLSIGPRTEMEVFNLLAAGFQIQNIVAIDLISSSPLIDTGDMHQMPYADRTFDVVISSWVLSYSSEPQRAVDEMIRVCADGGMVALGITYEPALGTGVVVDAETATAITGSNYASAAQLKELIGARLDRTYFEQDPDAPDRTGAVMLIARIKHRA
ncbi:MAG: SAM-dependent methyltransferase [Rhodospirillaceae bacterium]|nr:MAG: SAM-dependent methyltransferase [Rhodospirillaceae bacterium]